MPRPRGLFWPSYWLAAARHAPELGKYLGYRLRCRPYSDYYAAMMRRKAKAMEARTADDRWAEVGRRQFEFIRTHGLEARHSLLDFGCGSLRTGLHFIEFVEPANYWGVDISGEALAAGRRLLSERGLEWRRPTLRVVTDLSFEWADGRTFDFVIAQKVLNHMPWEDVEAFLRNARRVMSAESVLIAGFIDGAVTDPRGARFHYREAALESLAEAHGYRSEIVVDPRASCKGCRLEKASGVRTGLEAAHRHGKHLKLSLLPTINDLRPSGDA